jgi:hypothetical protein
MAKPHQLSTPTPNPRRESAEPELEPQELFAFLAEHDEYPASGQRLAEEARAANASPKVVEFFEEIPVTLKSESDVVEHALKPDEPPYGKTLDLGNSSGEARPPELPPEDTTLLLSDIKPDEK